MANTYLYRRKGEQFTANDGTILAGGFVYFYQAGTAVLQATYSDAAGTVPNTNPIALNSDGRLTQAVYLGTAGDYKELVTTSGGATVDPWPFDNIPAAVATVNTQGFAYPLLNWKFVTSASSPVSPAATDAGSAYEADTTSGNIIFNLPSAATVGSGKGFTFKNTAEANAVTINPNGAQTIDGYSSLGISVLQEAVTIVSDGANWQTVSRNGEFAPGDIKPTKRTTTPSGWLYCNGQAVLRATYPALDAAIYCGDGVNGTATECYRCTDPANPSTSRSTSGTYIVIPDLRAEFLRGWDDARGVDSGRALNSSQTDQLQDHTHNTAVLTATIAVSAGGAALANSGGATNNITSSAPVSGNHGAETRPRNRAVRWLMRAVW